MSNLGSNSFIANVNLLVSNLDNIIDINDKFTDERIEDLTLLKNIDIKVLVDDIAKGTNEGKRKIDIDLFKNYVGYSSDLTELEKQELYANSDNAGKYSGVNITFNDSTVVNYPFKQGTNNTLVTTNCELYNQLASNTELNSKLVNTTITSVPVEISTDMVMISDTGNSSNIISIELVTTTPTLVKSDLIYTWNKYTSSLELLVTYLDTLLKIYDSIPSLETIPSLTEELLASINTARQSLEDFINTKTPEITDMVNNGKTDIETLTNNSIESIETYTTNKKSDISAYTDYNITKLNKYVELAKAWAQSDDHPDPDDNTSRSAKYWAEYAQSVTNVQKATTTTLGLVKIGSGVQVDTEGSISVSGTDVDYTNLSNKPELSNVATSGDYDDLTNTPNFADVATSGSYTDLIDKPNFATVATTGDYNDLNNKPDSYSLPIASSDSLGGIKVGSNLDINDSGVLTIKKANVSQSGTGRVATNDEASTGVTGDDSPAFITPEQHANKLNKSNPVVYDTLNLDGTVVRKNNENSSGLNIYGGNDIDKNPFLQLINYTNSTVAGTFSLTAKSNATNGKSLIGSPNGTLSWNGNNILTTASGKAVDSAKADSATTATKAYILPSFAVNRVAAGGTFTVPSGGTWKVVSIADNSSEVTYANAYSEVAGGTILNWQFGNSGYTAVAVRVA